MRQTKIKWNRGIISFVAVSIIVLAAAAYPGASMAQEAVAESVLPMTRYAPGEFLPISAKLLNFGTNKRVDVSITYKVLDSSGGEIISSSETVAVETTASFIKLLQLPRSIKPGRYVASASILYSDQEFPAISQFEFSVERKFAGLFLSQWIIYGSLVALFGILILILARLILKKQKRDRFDPHDYGDVPKDDRIFYEMLSDIVAQMRLRVGDKAIEIAKSIDGLEIDENTCRIIKITKNPAKIVAILILKYENELGEKVSFSLRQTDDESNKKVKSLDRNLVVIRKYFE